MTVKAMVTGGSRSGKSLFAERMVRDLGGENVLYVATAEMQEGDGEMLRRVEEHLTRRPAGWETFEISYSSTGSSLLEALDAAEDREVVLLDSLTLWVSGKMSVGAGEELLDELDDYLFAAAELSVRLVIVTDEVGLGLVPDNPEGRRFRDLLGLANQRTAAVAEEVYLCVSGLPLKMR